MGFSEILDDIGGFGRYQWIHITLLSLPGLFMASQNLLNNFTAGVPAHHCAIPNITNRASYQNVTGEHLSTNQLLRAFIPQEQSSSKFTKCKRYVEPQWHLAGNMTGVNITGLETESCEDGWTYEKGEFMNTIVSEWDLVCKLRPLKQMSQTIYMGGVLSGAIIFGGLSDRFGRKAILVWSYFQLAVLGTFASLAPSYLAYCTMRFLSGMAVSGIILNSVSLKVEWIPTKERTLVGTLSSFFFTFGQMVLAGIAYSLRDWRQLHVAVCAPYFLFAIYSWWYSESARWLVLNGRSADALKQIHRVARMNGKPEMVDKITPEVFARHMKRELESSKNTYTAYDLVRRPVMRRISVCLLVLWFSTSFAYYGLAMDMQKFGVSIYTMQMIFGAVDIPAKLAALFLLSTLGRRITQSICLVMSAVLIFANIFISTEYQTVRTVLAVLGKGFTSSSFTCVYLFTGELYPTVIRQTGLGFTSTMSRIGSMAAPAVLILDEVWPSLPSIVYGGAALIAGIFALFLPETLNVPLPETVDDVEEKWSKTPHVQKQTEKEKENMVLKDVKDGGEECEDGKTSGLNAL